MEIESTEAWKAYIELRKKKQARAPFTEVAKERILSKLRAFEAQGQSIEAMLYQSVENGWTGVFHVKRATQPSDYRTVPSNAAAETQRYLEEQKPQPVSDARKAEVSRLLRETRERLARRQAA